MTQLEIVTPVPTENDIKRAIIQYLILKGCLVLRVNSGAAMGQYEDKKGNVKKRFMRFSQWYAGGVTFEEGQAGVSDILALWLPPKGPSKLLAIETKTPARRFEVTDAQRRFMAEIEARGGMAIVASSVDDLIKALDDIQKVIDQ